MYHGLFLINHRVPESQSHISSPWLVGYKLIRGSRMNQPGFHGMSQEFGRSLLSCEKGQIVKHYKLLCLWFVWFILGQHSYWPPCFESPILCRVFTSTHLHAPSSVSWRQVRSTEVLLPNGVGEEATLPGLMGSFGEVVSWTQYDPVMGTSSWAPNRNPMILAGFTLQHRQFGKTMMVDVVSCVGYLVYYIW